MDTNLPQHLDGAILAGLTGSVVQTVGLTAAVADFPAPVGALVSIERQSGPGIESGSCRLSRQANVGHAFEQSRWHSPRQSRQASSHDTYATR